MYQNLLIKEMHVGELFCDLANPSDCKNHKFRPYFLDRNKNEIKSSDTTLNASRTGKNKNMESILGPLYKLYIGLPTSQSNKTWQ
jgi:hypothetical protein